MGASESDIQSVKLVVGANSALYGPNAFNGVIVMNLKDPFLQPGTSVLFKVGNRSLLETGDSACAYSGPKGALGL